MKIAKTAVILAGGKSSRMNYNNKAFLTLEENTFINRIINALVDYEEIIIVANNKDYYKDFNIKIVEDIYVGQGPLSGIHVALKKSKYDKCLFVACDMPLINRKVVNYLGSIEEDYEVLIPKINGKYQPLCGIYSKKIGNLIESKIKNSENKLMKFCLETKYKIIENFPNNITSQEVRENFINVNTPEEYEKLETIIKGEQ